MNRYVWYPFIGMFLWLAVWAAELVVRLGILSSFGPPEVLRCYGYFNLVLLPGLFYSIPGLVIGIVFLLLVKRGDPVTLFPAFTALNAALIFLFYAGLWVHLSVLAGIGQLELVSIVSTILLVVAALLIHIMVRRTPLNRVSLRVILSACFALVTVASVLFWFLPGKGRTSGFGGSTEEGKDILIVTLDTVRRDALGCYGNTIFATTTLDSLARNGFMFTEAVSQSPFTGPSHASLMTALYPASHNIRTNGMHLGDGTLTMARLLTDNDYTCAAVLSGSSLSHDECGLNEGFVIYDDVLTPLEGFMRTSLGESVLRTFKKLRPGTFARLYRKFQERKAAITTDKALDYLRRMEGRVFLWVHYFDSHFTYDPPPPFATMYDPGFSGRFRPYDFLSIPSQVFDNTIRITEREKQHAWALYGGEMSYQDREIGRLLATIGEMGRLDNMLVVVVSDHGEYFGEYGKYFMHDGLAEEVLKVPMIMVDPGGGLEGLEVGPLAEVVDIMPTILQINKLPIPDGLQGRSLLTGLKDRAYAFSDCGWCGKVSVRGRGSMLILDLATGDQEVITLDETGDPVSEEDIALLRTAIEDWKTTVGLEGASELSTEESERLKSLGYIH